MKECKCQMRQGAHEWHCGCVGEYDYVHCKMCDVPVWMCSMALAMCSECRHLYEKTPVSIILGRPVFKSSRAIRFEAEGAD